MIIPWVYDQTPTGFAQLAMAGATWGPRLRHVQNGHGRQNRIEDLPPCGEGFAERRRKCGTGRDL